MSALTTSILEWLRGYLSKKRAKRDWDKKDFQRLVQAEHMARLTVPLSKLSPETKPNAHFSASAARSPGAKSQHPASPATPQAEPHSLAVGKPSVSARRARKERRKRSSAMNVDAFDVLNKIGEGGFGTVLLVRKKVRGGGGGG